MAKKAETYEDALLAIARSVKDTYAVGDFSRFMDEPADFDTADDADLATTIGEAIIACGWSLTQPKR